MMEYRGHMVDALSRRFNSAAKSILVNEPGLGLRLASI